MLGAFLRNKKNTYKFLMPHKQTHEARKSEKEINNKIYIDQTKHKFQNDIISISRLYLIKIENSSHDFVIHTHVNTAFMRSERFFFIIFSE